MPVLADDDVIVHRHAERSGDVNDRLGHLDVRLRGRGIATWVIVHEHSAAAIRLIKFRFSKRVDQVGTRSGDGNA
jgi:hypothetical protein